MPETVSPHDSAQAIMAAHPSSMGWHRVKGQPCNGKHAKLPTTTPPMVLWRRRRDYIAETSCTLLDPVDDPALWVAESVGIALCVTDSWVTRQRVFGSSEIIVRDLGNPWAVSGDGYRVEPGMTVTLTTANGQWIYVVDGERASCCAGYTARWAD